MALDFLACGLDPERTVFFRQSDVPEVTELTWLLSAVTPMGLLERCHSYKDKVAKGIAGHARPVRLPGADGGGHPDLQSNVVPVGRDQKQHVEVTRDIAIKFNNLYGEVFTIPEPSIREEVAVVPGLDGQKMSKSYDNTIEIFGDPKEARASIMRIVTDSKTRGGPEGPGRRATCSRSTSCSRRTRSARRWRRGTARGGLGYGEVKKALFEKFEAHFAPFRKKRAELQKDPGYVEAVLRKGAERARAEARQDAEEGAPGGGAG